MVMIEAKLQFTTSGYQSYSRFNNKIENLFPHQCGHPVDQSFPCYTQLYSYPLHRAPLHTRPPSSPAKTSPPRFGDRMKVPKIANELYNLGFSFWKSGQTNIVTKLDRFSKISSITLSHLARCDIDSCCNSATNSDVLFPT